MGEARIHANAGFGSGDHVADLREAEPGQDLGSGAGREALRSGLLLAVSPGQQHADARLDASADEVDPVPLRPQLGFPARAVDENEILPWQLELRLGESVTLNPEIGR